MDRKAMPATMDFMNHNATPGGNYNFMENMVMMSSTNAAATSYTASSLVE